MTELSEYFECPCCGFDTLTTTSSFEGCYMCDWEDDGQDDYNADQIQGGPNGDYSLTEARNNFKKYFIMYHPSDYRFNHSNKELRVKKEIIKYFNELKRHDLSAIQIKNIRNKIEANVNELLELQNKRFSE